jgi:triosephosphate isomerase
MRRTLIAGNWKMNGLSDDGLRLAEALAQRLQQANDYGDPPPPACELLICPPFTLLWPVRDAVAGSGIALGGQDCHTAESGAHTGDVSAAMLADLGCTHVILGHSERRADHAEGDALVQAKTRAALEAGLTPIVCVGETEAQRDAGDTLKVIAGQVQGSIPAEALADEARDLVVAYEPVWAIGTGRTATPEQVQEVHAALRGQLRELLGAGRADRTRLLYGGSVKPANAEELLALEDVDGALVGGASLKAEDFWAIAAFAPA